MSDFDPSKLFIFGRDTIVPSPFRTLAEPQVVAADRVRRLADDDELMSLTVNGQHRAYPVRVVAPHHIVEDVIADTPVTVTF